VIAAAAVAAGPAVKIKVTSENAMKRVGVPTGSTGFSRKMSVMNYQLIF
jgi:hypothetical protein